MRARTLLLTLVVLGLVAWGAKVLVDKGVGLLPDPESCQATVGERTVTVSPKQAENAALIAGVAVRRELPPRAVSIALATAFQESKLHNIAYGDRDSVGLFQQRPSQGWGTRKQLLDPLYATNAFYDALVKIDGYSTMRITEAAQAVQRSAYPEAYDAHAADARILASALTGQTEGGSFHCEVSSEPDASATALTPAGLTARASRVRRDVERVFGAQRLGGFAPGGVSTGHMAGSAHYEGRAIDVSIDPDSASDRQRGWAMAAFLVARAERLDIDHVIFDGRIWTRWRSDEGWRDYQPPDNASGDPRTLMHRDHVHVDVAR
ncbi:MAG: hypothetical protein V9F00_13430 [Nocardioides sp.]